MLSALCNLDLDVRICVCDGAGENKRFIRCMMAKCQPVTNRDICEGAFMYSHYTKTGVRSKIFFMSDASHLITVIYFTAAAQSTPATNWYSYSFAKSVDCCAEITQSVVKQLAAKR